MLTSMTWPIDRVENASGLKMNVATMRAFSRAMKQGSKYLYQTVPRLLTIWLDLGEHGCDDPESVKKCRDIADKAIREVPAYKVCFKIDDVTQANHYSLVVYCLSTGCFACRTSRSGNIQDPWKAYSQSLRRVSKASTMAFHLCGQVNQTQPPTSWKNNSGTASGQSLVKPPGNTVLMRTGYSIILKSPGPIYQPLCRSLSRWLTNSSLYAIIKLMTIKGHWICERIFLDYHHWATVNSSSHCKNR